MRMGRTFGAALTARRALGAAEAGSLIWGVVLFGALGFVGVKWPKGLAYPFGVFFLWVGVSWTIQVLKLLRRRQQGTVPATKPAARQDTAA